MVNIDDVYQKVLAIANKEQRGYITPQEFNLYADQAQREIFEQYFYDLDKFSIMSNDRQYEYQDSIDRLNEKISFFESNGSITGATTYANLNGTNLYRLGTVYLTNGTTDTFAIPPHSPILVEQVQEDEIIRMFHGPLTKPTFLRPVFTRRSENTIVIYPTEFNKPTYSGRHTYIKSPSGGAGNKPQWGYFVVGGKALHDTDTSKTTHFSLHESEETELVYKILKYAGVSMKKADLAQQAQGLETLQIMQEKS